MLPLVPANRPRRATPPGLPAEVAVVGLIQSDGELAEIASIQAIQRWVCYLHARLNRAGEAPAPDPSKPAPKAY